MKEQKAITFRSPSEIYPEYFLIRVNEFDKVAVTPLEEWVKYLKTGIISPDTQTPGLAEARERLRYYNMTTAERQAYDKHIDAIRFQNDILNTAKWEGLMEGRMEGREEGKREKQQEIARNLKANGVPIDIIVKSTGLSAEEITALS